MEPIAPYVRQPEELLPGKPLYFATAMPLGGVATGVLAESHQGRPTKIEGNPDHPASFGATDAFAQASVLTLYDPDRSQTLTHLGEISAYPAFLGSFRTVVRTAHGPWAERDGVIVRLQNEEGAIGFGEAAVVPWFGTETVEEVDAATERRLADALTLAQQLGGVTMTFNGPDLARAAAAFVREYGITHVVLGRSRRPWYRRLFGRPVLDRLLEALPEVDVVVVDAAK